LNESFSRRRLLHEWNQMLCEPRDNFTLEILEFTCHPQDRFLAEKCHKF
jgi:hypothetical protein